MNGQAHPMTGDSTQPAAGTGSSSAMSEAKALTSDAKAEVKRLGGAAKDTAKETAAGTVTRKKDDVALALTSIAGALREAGQKLEQEKTAVGQYAAPLSDGLDRVSRYLQERSPNDLVRDAETFARRHPDVFLGGAFFAGLLAARFLKSSPPAEEATAMAPASEPFNPPHFAEVPRDFSTAGGE